jgi:hypothetical protein
VRRLCSITGITESMLFVAGASASLVIGGRLRNVPREEHGRELRGGREIATALGFVAH